MDKFNALLAIVKSNDNKYDILITVSRIKPIFPLDSEGANRADT